MGRQPNQKRSGAWRNQFSPTSLKIMMITKKQTILIMKAPNERLKRIMTVIDSAKRHLVIILRRMTLKIKQRILIMKAPNERLKRIMTVMILFNLSFGAFMINILCFIFSVILLSIITRCLLAESMTVMILFNLSFGAFMINIVCFFVIIIIFNDVGENWFLHAPDLFWFGCLLPYYVRFFMHSCLIGLGKSAH